MKIYVCVKHVPDTAADITITGRTQIDEEITFIVNPYDEHAIEEAVRLKKKVDQAEIIAVTLGKKTAEDTLRSALAMGADRGILIIADTTVDPLVIARALQAAIEQDGTADIIFTGKESIDSEGSQVMYRLGALFNMPVVSNVVSFSMQQEKVSVECEMAAGERQVIEMPLPCIIGAGKGLNVPNYPRLPDIIKANRKPVKTMELTDLNVDQPASRIETIQIDPAVEQRTPKELTGTSGEVADKIIRILRAEANVLQ